MKKIARVSAAVGLLIFFVSFPGLSLAEGDMADRISDDLKISGPMEEGTDGKCTGNIPFGNCLEYQERNYVTLPNEVSVIEQKREEGASKGEIEYTFDCRTRETSFVPKGNARGKSVDHRSSGVVRADYVFAFDTLSLSNIRREGSGGRCGRSIVDKMDDRS